MLKERLQRIRESANRRIPAETRAIMEHVTEQLRQSRIAERSLKAGQIAPDFALPDANGNLVESAELLARGPLAVSFYRGKW